MSDAALIPLAELETRALSWPEEATIFIVASQEHCELVADRLRDIKALRAEIGRTFDPIDRAQIEARKVTIAQRKKIEDPLVQAETLFKSKVGAYAAEQQRKAREVAALAEALAREAREKAEKEARELEAAGERELADAVREESAVASAAPVLPPPVKVAGISIGETWTFEVTDLKALVAACASGSAPLAFLQPNETAIGQMARAVKGTQTYPGVRIYAKPRVGTR
jgi:hypothetical protein